MRVLSMSVSVPIYRFLWQNLISISNSLSCHYIVYYFFFRFSRSNSTSFSLRFHFSIFSVRFFVLASKSKRYKWKLKDIFSTLECVCVVVVAVQFTVQLSAFICACESKETYVFVRSCVCVWLPLWLLECATHFLSFSVGMELFHFRFLFQIFPASLRLLDVRSYRKLSIASKHRQTNCVCCRKKKEKRKKESTYIDRLFPLNVSCMHTRQNSGVRYVVCAMEPNTNKSFIVHYRLLRIVVILNVVDVVYL